MAMRTKTTDFSFKQIKGRALLAVSVIAIVIGLSIDTIVPSSNHPFLMFLNSTLLLSGGILLPFALINILMDYIKIKNPKKSKIINTLTKNQNINIKILPILTTISIFIAVMQASGSSSNHSDSTSILFILFMFLIPGVSIVVFLTYSISHILKKTESYLMLALRIIAILIVIMLLNNPAEQSSGGFNGLNKIISAWLYGSCILLVIGTYLPEKIYLRVTK